MAHGFMGGWIYGSLSLPLEYTVRTNLNSSPRDMKPKSGAPAGVGSSMVVVVGAGVEAPAPCCKNPPNGLTTSTSYNSLPAVLEMMKLRISDGEYCIRVVMNKCVLCVCVYACVRW